MAHLAEEGEGKKLRTGMLLSSLRLETKDKETLLLFYHYASTYINPKNYLSPKEKMNEMRLEKEMFQFFFYFPS